MAQSPPPFKCFCKPLAHSVLMNALSERENPCLLNRNSLLSFFAVEILEATKNLTFCPPFIVVRDMSPPL